MTKRKSEQLKKCCGLCGNTNTNDLTLTECCNQWICDDEHTYVMFSYERNSCHRNHDRYTLCGSHYHEGHSGHWQNCEKCRNYVKTEMYVYFGTNEYNFEKLRNIPSYEPTHCTRCENIINLSEDGYSISKGGYFCYECSNFPDALA